MSREFDSDDVTGNAWSLPDHHAPAVTAEPWPDHVASKNRLFFYLRGFKHGVCMLAKPPASAGNEDYERGYIAGARAFSHAENKERSILGLPKSSLLR